MHWYEVRVKGKGTVMVKAGWPAAALLEAEARLDLTEDESRAAKVRQCGEYTGYADVASIGGQR